MRFASCTLAVLICVSMSLVAADAAIILPTDTQGLTNTYTTADGLVTLNAYAATDPLTPGLFNTGSLIGVSDAGNANAVNDADGDPATGADQQAIDIVLDATVGFSQIVFNWSRADGPAPTDGIQIAGFASDPGAVVSSGPAYDDLRWDAGLSSVFFNAPGTSWGQGAWTLDFPDLVASGGQTLRITANDSDQVGSQAAMESISYEIIPEPSVLALLALGLGMTVLRRLR